LNPLKAHSVHGHAENCSLEKRDGSGSCVFVPKGNRGKNARKAKADSVPRSSPRSSLRSSAKGSRNSRKQSVTSLDVPRGKRVLTRGNSSRAVNQRKGSGRSIGRLQSFVSNKTTTRSTRGTTTSKRSRTSSPKLRAERPSTWTRGNSSRAVNQRKGLGLQRLAPNNNYVRKSTIRSIKGTSASKRSRTSSPKLRAERTSRSLSNTQTQRRVSGRSDEPRAKSQSSNSLFSRKTPKSQAVRGKNGGSQRSFPSGALKTQSRITNEKPRGKRNMQSSSSNRQPSNGIGKSIQPERKAKSTKPSQSPSYSPKRVPTKRKR
jgi:hypothetical protein